MAGQVNACACAIGVAFLGITSPMLRSEMVGPGGADWEAASTVDIRRRCLDTCIDDEDIVVALIWQPHSYQELGLEPAIGFDEGCHWPG